MNADKRRYLNRPASAKHLIHHLTRYVFMAGMDAAADHMRRSHPVSVILTCSGANELSKFMLAIFGMLVMPVILPTVLRLGFDPVLMMEAGLITPPLGLNIFVIAGLRMCPWKSFSGEPSPFFWQFSPLSFW